MISNDRNTSVSPGDVISIDGKTVRMLKRRESQTVSTWSALIKVGQVYRWNKSRREKSTEIVSTTKWLDEGRDELAKKDLQRLGYDKIAETKVTA